MMVMNDATQMCNYGPDPDPDPDLDLGSYTLMSYIQR